MKENNRILRELIEKSVAFQNNSFEKNSENIREQIMLNRESIEPLETWNKSAEFDKILLNELKHQQEKLIKFFNKNWNFNNKFEKLLDFENDLFITGGPGTGKTSLLRYVEYIARGSNKYKPIFISLSEIRYFDDQEIETVQRSKKLVFLIDGLDEVPFKLRTESIKYIEKLRLKHPEACFIITSRLLVDNEEPHFNNFIVLHINVINLTSRLISVMETPTPVIKIPNVFSPRP